MNSTKPSRKAIIPSEKIGMINLYEMFLKADEIDFEEGKTAYVKYNFVMNMFVEEFGYDIEKITAAFVAMSPNNDYVGNLRSLHSVLDGLKRGVHIDKIKISTYNHCKLRAYNYLKGEDFLTKKRGLKISSFYRNIIDPSCKKWVTVDGHIAAAYIGDPKLTMKDVLISRKNYQIICNSIFKIAEELEMIPNQLQAAIWFTRKRTLKIKYNPVIDMFSKENDNWKILMPLDELPVYEISNAMQQKKMPSEENFKQASIFI